MSVIQAMLDKISYLSFLDNVGQGQLSQFSRQCWTTSVISVSRQIMDKVSYLSCPGRHHRTRPVFQVKMDRVSYSGNV